MSGIQPLALVIASDVRIAVVDTLDEGPKGFVKIQEDIEKVLDRKVSDGSLTWHLTKLDAANVVTHGSKWSLTSFGKELVAILDGIKAQMS